MKILAIIFDGFEEEEAMAPFAILRRAKADLTIASTNTTVKGNHNIYLSNITPLKDINYKDFYPNCYKNMPFHHLLTILLYNRHTSYHILH